MSTHRQRLVAVGVVLSLIAVGCGDSSPVSYDVGQNDDRGSEITIDETPFLSPFLVPVEGYRYANASAAEYEHVFELHESIEADIGGDFYGAVLLHSVIADDPAQNTAQARTGDMEVGYLALMQLNEAVPDGVDEELATSIYRSPAIDRLDVAGVSVFVFEDPQSPDSRYTYHWLDHGVQGSIDGADREPLERWLTAYLAAPKLAESETEGLADRLTSVSGFTYSNVDTSLLSDQVAPLSEVSYSMHKVADADGSIGILTLIETEDAAFVGRWITETWSVRPVDEATLGQGQANHFVGVVDDDQSHAFGWTEAGIGGVLTTNPADLDSAERFLGAFLESDATPVVRVDTPECVPAGADRALPLFDDFEAECRIIDVTAGPGEVVRLTEGSLELTLSDGSWFRFIDLESPVPDLSVSLSVTMPPAADVAVACYGPRPSTERYEYQVLADPAEVLVALFHVPGGGQPVLLNSDTIPRTEITEPMQIVLSCHADDGGVEVDGEVDWALLEASVSGCEGFAGPGVCVEPAEEPSESFQAVVIRFGGREFLRDFLQESDPLTYIVDNLAITE